MISLRIVTPYGLYKEVETSILNVVTTAGQMGILPGHMPLVAMLEISKLTTEEKGSRETYALSGGMIYFDRDKATIVAPSVENVKDIDTARAQKAKERAEERLSSPKEDTDIQRAEPALKGAEQRLDNPKKNTDIKRAQLALKRAMNRLSI